MREIGIGPFRNRFRRQHQCFERALVDQAVDHAGADAGFAGCIAFAAQHTVCKKRQHPLPRRRHALWGRAGKTHADALALGAEVLAHAQAHPQHHAAGGDRVVRHPVDEAAQLCAQRRQFELSSTSLRRLSSRGLASGLRPDHGSGLAGAERHADDVAGRKLKRLGHPVGIGPVKRDRDQDIDDTADHAAGCADSSGFRKGKGWRLYPAP